MAIATEPLAPQAKQAYPARYKIRIVTAAMVPHFDPA